MSSFFKNNGLAIVFLGLFIISIAGQFFTGYNEHNKQREEDGQQPLTMGTYITSGHFLQATFENWESEFLQMALFVVLTVSLRQKGSSESKKMDEKEPVDREPRRHQDAPWPVHKGGILLTLYKHSLTIVLALLFVLSFIVHLYGSLKDENEQRTLKGEPLATVGNYLGESRFWFESFQNWQSEFLAVFAIVILSIFLREKGSPQSKPVDAPHSETGD